MTEIRQSGQDPAFPVSMDMPVINPTGLSKREYFAVMAMQGLISAHPAQVGGHAETAEIAVRHADALLFQLDKEAK